MQKSQILAHGVEGVLAERLRALAESHRIWLRETNQFEACRNALKDGAPSVLVFMLGRDLEREMTLLELVHASMPETVTLVIGEVDNPVLAGLAWELGASIALFPPTPVEQVTELILRNIPNNSDEQSK